mmetsp:Transcript_14767/g.33632  ORF Transcript_14767/g.33632 Transcript_14767/m.33632 type:complete len:231 (-) Transcript_14767:9-701(-)
MGCLRGFGPLRHHAVGNKQVRNGLFRLSRIRDTARLQHNFLEPRAFNFSWASPNSVNRTDPGRSCAELRETTGTSRTGTRRNVSPTNWLGGHRLRILRENFLQGVQVRVRRQTFATVQQIGNHIQLLHSDLQCSVHLASRDRISPAIACNQPAMLSIPLPGANRRPDRWLQALLHVAVPYSWRPHLVCSTRITARTGTSPGPTLDLLWLWGRSRSAGHASHAIDTHPRTC